MGTTNIRELRNCAEVIFAYTLSRLRDSFVSSLPTRNIVCKSDHIAVNLVYVTGHMASDEPMLSDDVNKNYPDSLTDLRHQWSYIRQMHDRDFALRGEPLDRKEGELCSALRSCLQFIGRRAPPGCHFSSHSRRIGPHSSQVLLHIPRESRMADFGSGPQLEAMTKLHFDRTIEVTPVVHCFSGAKSPFPAASFAAARR